MFCSYVIAGTEHGVQSIGLIKIQVEIGRVADTDGTDVIWKLLRLC